MSSPGDPLELRFHTVDVFTSTRYLGNPLALIHLPPNTALSQSQKQALAREFNLSETVIIHAATGNPLERTIDIFTTDAEIPFAGHPTIGTLCHLGRIASSPSPISLTLHVRAGTMHGQYDGGAQRARAGVPHDVQFSGLARCADTGLRYPAATARTFPVVSPVRGMTFMLVELDSAAQLAACDAAAMVGDLAHVRRRRVRAEVTPTLLATYFWTLAGAEQEAPHGVLSLECRMMLKGVPAEDPATGSAACTLAAALSLWRRDAEREEGETEGDGDGEGEPPDAARGYRPTCVARLRVPPGRARDRYEICQGRDMGRLSRITVEVAVKPDGSGIDEVVLEGQAVDVMEGTIRV